ncbi:hypothetical protein COCC4DRAFT_173902 [Bipolaris maydis ATCC 48331]|uniref:Uncharacterized protein n=2 Tax=Cochliobolus heterostrophus TaxID=5016 RepID=M2THV3_COCH5|nr:uncharacterized protein COCC4DRAFT_173902 [Bipolaris maydis ATCC 48331]EMD97010.1 hypothetical protein COCHEDRAFT_1163343 [Bipolaris maydis C5]KAH7564502.1 hypothetical protein BM1_01549 [Bipolaris maydis]EMD97807.1 hypothetical protein COCHEDRAFT_1125709 [Bipolaris maydis C5]ENI02797.1 hypothetical protein COCC4DRAFT_173902 [Bipolaris maydis ATCC 48331]KAJ5031879.1 hypothetical protein J3E73DRAFT_419984 [Bipolaris maydis]
MAESLAAFRDRQSKDLQKLAEEHLQHDLQQQDRDTLKSAAGKVTRNATIGSALGLGLGIYTAFRLRAMRLAYFKAFRAMEKPVEVRFADGRTEKIPDITAQVSGPSRWGDAAAYFFFSVGGLFLGGELGLLTGTASASRVITKDPESRARIEKAFKNYRIDVLQREIEALRGKSRFEEFFRSGGASA